MIVMHLDYLLIFYFMYTVHAKHHMLKVEQVLFVFLKTVQPLPIFGQYKLFCLNSRIVLNRRNLLCTRTLYNLHMYSIMYEYV